jgi:hypothetical protein
MFTKRSTVPRTVSPLPTELRWLMFAVTNVTAIMPNFKNFATFLSALQFLLE